MSSDESRIAELEEVTHRQSKAIRALVQVSNLICDWVNVASEEIESVDAIKETLTKAQAAINELQNDVQFIGNTMKVKDPTDD